MSDDLPFDPMKSPNRKFKAELHVPDLTEAVEGWRVWQVALQLPLYGNHPRMYSAGGGGNYFWAPRRISLAECEKCGPNVPGEFCSCGFYSAKDYKHLMSMGYPSYDIEDGYIMVLGQVANWGKVIEGTEGWRAAKCYPKRLWVPYEAAEKLGPALKRAYGVPVGMKNWLSDMGRTYEY